MYAKNLILVVVTILLILSPVDAGTLEAQNASVTGYIQAQDGVGFTTSNSALHIGTSGDLATKYRWKRTFIRFDLTGQDVIQKAELHLFYQDTTTNGGGAVFDVNIQSVNDIGNLGTGDYYATKFNDINSDVFASTTDENQIIDVTDTWNDAIDNSRDYLTLMFAINNEPSFTNPTSFRYLEFCDVGDTFGDCDGSPTNPRIEFTPVPPPTVYAISGSSRILFGLTPFIIIAAVMILAILFFRNQVKDPNANAASNISTLLKFLAILAAGAFMMWLILIVLDPILGVTL